MTIAILRIFEKYFTPILPITVNTIIVTIEYKAS